MSTEEKKEIQWCCEFRAKRLEQAIKHVRRIAKTFSPEGETANYFSPAQPKNKLLGNTSVTWGHGG
ncbi:MAG: hypothetical protein KAI66_04905, partial [Lentisphaeria bacterium]|nr:hypothetical protein [Lentisphaeria bacterium]